MTVRPFAEIAQVNRTAAPRTGFRRRRCACDLLRCAPTDSALPKAPIALVAAACIAIIVPFRRQAEQDRDRQLAMFLQHMSKFLRGARFAIVVVEQSDDDRKFNRGQLLNIGFVEALRHADPGELISAIFHDVDLLPNDALLPWYLEGPKRGRPVHLAYPATWDKYAGMGKYEDVFFGGVTAFHPGECHSVSATATDCH